MVPVGFGNYGTEENPKIGSVDQVYGSGLTHPHLDLATLPILGFILRSIIPKTDGESFPMKCWSILDVF